MAAELTPAAYEALAEFHYCVRKLLAASKEAQSQPVMETLDVELLLSCRYYSRRGSLTLTDLRERLGVNQTSLLRLIDRAVQNKWLERRSAKRTARGVFLHVTPRAEAKLAQMAEYHRDCLRSLSATLMQSLDSLTG